MDTKNTFFAINPATNEKLEGAFTNATGEQIDRAVEQASHAFDLYRKKNKKEIADFLDQAAAEIMNLGDALLERCHLETALPLGRLRGERGRTVNQLKLFASVVREGSWVDVRIDTALPDRAPIPRPDIRQMLIPLGPVAVFGASNFPLAFSVAGGDTASALAAGCPVVVKGHPAHPGTSEMVAQAFYEAVRKCSMPAGTFTLIQGTSHEVGGHLVKHPKIKAVGFTGSFRGGKALFDLANARPEPIPVFAEMGSTNPVFILPGALADNPEKIAAGLVNSITLGVGQFCTNPGLALAKKSAHLSKLEQAMTQAMSEVAASTMLTSGIKNAYEKGIHDTDALENVVSLASGKQGDAPNQAQAHIFKTSIQDFAQNKFLSEENFGPSNVLVEAENKDQILKAARNLEGHLTATVHCNEEDMVTYRELFEILEHKVGRIIINGYPTGVEVCHAMVHGGPFPATTAPQSTSVGTLAIKRFARPLCFQDYPQSLLPVALRDENSWGIWRLVNGELLKDGM